jgi:hypothetical protein
MTIDHYTPAEVDALRVEYPDHFIVEVATPAAACLVAVPKLKATAELAFCGMPIDMVDGCTLYSKPNPT